MKWSKKLTISIPTYNRVTYLERAIESILNQISIESDIEIVVCDNASSDRTEEVMNEYCRKYSFIKYIRQRENLGPDFNILTCLQSASGRYVQLLSDDDFLIDGALESYKKYILSAKSYSIIYLNSIWYNDTKHIDANNKSIKIYEDIEFSDKNKFLENIWIHFTFLSGIIINREEFLKINMPEKFIGTYLLQTNIALQCLASDLESLVISKPCIAALGGNSGGYNFYKVFIEEWGKILFDESKKLKFDEDIMKKIYIKTIKQYIVPSSISFKLEKTKFSTNGLGLVLRNTFKYKEAWLYLYPIVILPKKVLKLLVKIRSTFIKKQYI